LNVNFFSVANSSLNSSNFFYALKNVLSSKLGISIL
jgi:hypothetical protein